MKNDCILTEKEFTVLAYFIESESHVRDGLENFLQNPIIHSCEDKKKHFVAYPSKIEKDTASGYIGSTLISPISKRWAIKICKDFSYKGILDSEKLLPPRQKNRTKHYFLKDDIESFKKIFKMIMTSYDCDYRRKELFRKSYFQDIFNEAFIKKILNEKKVEMGRIIHIWDWKPVEAKTLFEKLCKKSELRYEDYILQMFLHKYAEKSMSYFPPSISLCLPVLPEDETDEQLKSIQKFNIRAFKELPSLDYNLSGICDHYNRFQKSKWIIPLLSLIQSSPKALEEFLYGEWNIEHLDNYVFTERGHNFFEYPFFKILFAAISDITLTREVRSTNIEYAIFGSMSNNEFNWLLSITMKSGIRTYFDGGFDTFEHVIGFENGDVLVNPKERNYWTRTWHDYSANFYSLELEDILDFDSLVKIIVENKDVCSKHLFDGIPHHMKNILLIISKLPDITEGFKNDFLLAINEIIFSSNFAKEINFKTLNLTEYTVNRIKYLDKIEMNKFDSKFEKPHLVHEINRLILEDVFENVIRKKERIFYGGNYLPTIKSGEI